MFQVPESVEILLALTSDPAPVCLLALKILRNLSFHSGNRPRFLCDGTAATFPSSISLSLLSRWLKCKLYICMFFLHFTATFIPTLVLKLRNSKEPEELEAAGVTLWALTANSVIV